MTKIACEISIFVLNTSSQSRSPARRARGGHRNGPKKQTDSPTPSNLAGGIVKCFRKDRDDTGEATKENVSLLIIHLNGKDTYQGAARSETRE